MTAGDRERRVSGKTHRAGPAAILNSNGADSISPRADVIDKLVGFLQLKERMPDKAKALLWRCAAEGRGIGPFGALTAAEVCAAIDRFDAEVNLDEDPSDAIEDDVVDGLQIWSSTSSRSGRDVVGDKRRSWQDDRTERSDTDSRGQHRSSRKTASDKLDLLDEKDSIPRPWGPELRRRHRELLERQRSSTALAVRSQSSSEGDKREPRPSVRERVVHEIADYLREQSPACRESAKNALRKVVRNGWRIAGVSSLQDEEVERAVMLSLQSGSMTSQLALPSRSEWDRIHQNGSEVTHCHRDVEETSVSKNSRSIAWSRVVEVLRNESRFSCGDSASSADGETSSRIGSGKLPGSDKHDSECNLHKASFSCGDEGSSGVISALPSGDDDSTEHGVTSARKKSCREAGPTSPRGSNNTGFSSAAAYSSMSNGEDQEAMRRVECDDTWVSDSAWSAWWADRTPSAGSGLSQHWTKDHNGGSCGSPREGWSRSATQSGARVQDSVAMAALPWHWGTSYSSAPNMVEGSTYFDSVGMSEAWHQRDKARWWSEGAWGAHIEGKTPSADGTGSWWCSGWASAKEQHNTVARDSWWEHSRPW